MLSPLSPYTGGEREKEMLHTYINPHIFVFLFPLPAIVVVQSIDVEYEYEYDKKKPTRTETLCVFPFLASSETAITTEIFTLVQR